MKTNLHTESKRLINLIHKINELEDIDLSKSAEIRVLESLEYILNEVRIEIKLKKDKIIIK